MVFLKLIVEYYITLFFLLVVQINYLQNTVLSSWTRLEWKSNLFQVQSRTVSYSETFIVIYAIRWQFKCCKSSVVLLYFQRRLHHASGCLRNRATNQFRRVSCPGSPGCGTNLTELLQYQGNVS